MNPHIELLQETVKLIGTRKWLEVSYVFPFGFHEVKEPTRKNISVEDFLYTSVDSDFDTCVFHILLGCGVKLDIFIEALELYPSVIILEHDSTSTDWNSEAIRREHCIANCITSEELLKIAEQKKWSCSEVYHMKNNRNMIMEITR